MDFSNPSHYTSLQTIRHLTIGGSPYNKDDILIINGYGGSAYIRGFGFTNATVLQSFTGDYQCYLFIVKVNSNGNVVLSSNENNYNMISYVVAKVS